ncbi:hypothetical protein ACF0H5_020870 [Mactra antiquata]
MRKLIKIYLISQILLEVLLIPPLFYIMVQWKHGREIRTLPKPRKEWILCMPKDVLIDKDHPNATILTTLEESNNSSELCGSASNVLTAALNASLNRMYNKAPYKEERSFDKFLPSQCNAVNSTLSIIKLTKPDKESESDNGMIRIKWGNASFQEGDKLEFSKGNGTIRIKHPSHYYIWSQVILECGKINEQRTVNHTVYGNLSKTKLLSQDTKLINSQSGQHAFVTTSSGAVSFLKKDDELFVEVFATDCNVTFENGSDEIVFHVYEVPNAKD